MKKNYLILVSCLIGGLIGVMEVSANTIGPKPIMLTDISKGTIYASPSGTGDTCSKQSPCNISQAISIAKKGAVVFLRGGTYFVTETIYFGKLHQGDASAPIIFESYPGETAVFDGTQLVQGAEAAIRIHTLGAFIQLRGIEVKNSPKQGIIINGSDNVLDGIHSHHNGLSGIQIYAGARNIIRNSIFHDNSDTGNPPASGSDADGIGISSGTDNRIENCLVYNNSDDGIDLWLSINSYVGYSISHSNGIGNGDGVGIKAGGETSNHVTSGADATVEHNLSYSNKAAGITYNLGKRVEFINNTTWNNPFGYDLGDDTIATIDPERIIREL